MNLRSPQWAVHPACLHFRENLSIAFCNPALATKVDPSCKNTEPFLAIAIRKKIILGPGLSLLDKTSDQVTSLGQMGATESPFQDKQKGHQVTHFFPTEANGLLLYS